MLKKEDFARKVKETLELSSMKEANRIIDGMVKVISDTMKDGEGITLPGIGKFEVATRAARTCRNPQTGEAVEVPEKKVVKFKVASAIKNVVNE